MKILYLLQSDSDTWGNVVVFIIIGIAIFVNVIRKAIQNAQKGQGEQGQAPKPRSRFLDLIEEVKRMAEEGGEPGHFTPRQPPPPETTEKINQKPVIIPPNVPRLKPIGGEKITKPSYQPQRQKPVTVQRPVSIRFIPQEDELPDEEEVIFASNVRKQFEAREKALRKREEALKVAEERLSKLEAGIEKRKAKTATSKKETAKELILSDKVTYYSAIIESPESLKNAIVLREILGPPRAIRKYRGLNR